VGAYCLGGCDPLFSNKFESCVPNPTCKDQQYKFDNLDSIMSIDKYLGDNSKAKWVSSGKPLPYNNNGVTGVILTMAQDTVGTLLATTDSVWYGQISAKMTTSQGKGVVTAFIMMSDVKDEIDFEFVGVDIDHAQSNYYSQGVTNYNHGANHSAANTREQVHTYTIDWQEDQLTWSVDGNVVRTLKRSDTWNSTSNRFDYPQTPSRVMLSLWPAGLPSNGEGTVNWAGGLIDWSSKYMQNGYYYAVVQEVTVKCYDPPKNAQVKGSGKKGYVYTDERGTNDTVAFVDDLVVLSSFYATGEDPKKDPNAAKSSSAAKPSGTSSASPEETSVETVPGMSGGGNRESDGQSAASGGNDGQATGTTNGGSPSPSSTSSGSSGGSGNSDGFSQNNGGKSSNAATLGNERRVGGSVFAVCVALLALLVL